MTPSVCRLEAVEIGRILDTHQNSRKDIDLSGVMAGCPLPEYATGFKDSNMIIADTPARDHCSKAIYMQIASK